MVAAQLGLVCWVGRIQWGASQFDPTLMYPRIFPPRVHLSLIRNQVPLRPCQHVSIIIPPDSAAQSSLPRLHVIVTPLSLMIAIPLFYDHDLSRHSYDLIHRLTVLPSNGIRPFNHGATAD